MAVCPAGRVRAQIAVLGIAAGIGARQIDAAITAAYGVLIGLRPAAFSDGRLTVAPRPPFVEPHRSGDQYNDEDLTKADGQGCAFSLAE